MIAFTCWKCGRAYDRPEASAGTMIFCDCGTGVTVPWESTRPVPVRPPLAAPVEPIPPTNPWTSWQNQPANLPPRDPAFCLVHTRAPSQHTCAQCGERFCGDCVLTLQGRTLCGPCKNCYLRDLQRPPSVSVAAVFAPIVALVTAPPAAFVLFMLFGLSVMERQSGGGAGNFATVLLVFGLIAGGVQGIAFLLAAYSLYTVETKPNYSGRSLAITGMAAAVVCTAMIGESLFLIYRLME